ncbi:AdoMet activation domain-containing protein [Gammaproteobacteria bacterium]
MSTTSCAPVSRDNSVPSPPFWGSRCLERISLNAVVPYINRTALYKFQWGFKSAGRSVEEYAAWIHSEVDPILNRLVKESVAENILQLSALYGYFPCQSQGNDLIIYSDPMTRHEKLRFTFPRQSTARGLCIADFFREIATEEIDVVAFQLVTVGQHTADYARSLFDADRYQEYLYWHGLNVEGVEGLAEWVHKRIRGELGFGNEDSRDLHELIKQHYRGSRYSFGYPACPNLADQNKILTLLGAERIGVTLGESDQLWPEESTSAIVVHHPMAKYFGV